MSGIVAPVAVNDSATVTINSGFTAINVLANDTDVDGDTLTVTGQTNGANGSASCTAAGTSSTAELMPSDAHTTPTGGRSARPRTPPPRAGCTA